MIEWARKRNVRPVSKTIEGQYLQEWIMNIALGCDHAGFRLKDAVREAISDAGHKVIDVGTNSGDPIDYPDYVEKVGKEITGRRAQRGVFICGSGVGACIAANKIRGIYAGMCHDTYSAHQGVEHDDMNVLCLGSRVIGPELARELVRAFLGAGFSGEERHLRRVEKIKQIENSATGNTAV
jgi:RpiB/LacA/LacB family sugar-phosphate isomerase